MRGRSLTTGVLGWATLCLAVIVVAGRVAAQTPSPPALEVQPAAIDTTKYWAGEPVRLQVGLKAGAKDLTDIVLSSFSNDGIVASVEGGDGAEKVAQLPANAEHVWMLRLKPSKGTLFPPAALKLNVRADYVEAANPPVARASFITVTINAPSTTALPAMAAITIKGALGALSYERPASAYVAVTNTYSGDLKILDIGIHGPRFVEFDPLKQQPYTLPFGETKVFAYEVKAPEQVVPGKYPVLVAVHLQGADGVTGSVTASQDVDVGVLGESDLLSKLGAPSLLFLPGVLFLLTWQLLASWRGAAAPAQGSVLLPTSPTFWLAGVIISLIMAVAYPYVVLWVLHTKRDYLVAYGLRDYIYVFALAIAASFVLFVGKLFVLWLGRMARAIWLSFYTPRLGDQPMTLLNKLAKHGADTTFAQAYVDGGNQNNLLLVLAPWSDANTYWLAPPVLVTLRDEHNHNAVGLLDQIDSGQITDAGRLAEIIQQGIDAGWWTIAWATVGQNSTVTTGPASTWRTGPVQARLVRAA